MKPPRRGGTGRHTGQFLGGFATGFLLVLLLSLCGCGARPAGTKSTSNLYAPRLTVDVPLAERTTSRKAPS